MFLSDSNESIVALPTSAVIMQDEFSFGVVELEEVPCHPKFDISSVDPAAMWSLCFHLLHARKTTVYSRIGVVDGRGKGLGL